MTSEFLVLSQGVRTFHVTALRYVFQAGRDWMLFAQGALLRCSVRDLRPLMDSVSRSKPAASCNLKKAEQACARGPQVERQGQGG